MSALSNLRDKYIADAADLTDDRDELQVLALIETWYAARVAADAALATSIQSYSIAGRTVNRKDDGSTRSNADMIEGQILQILYNRGVTHADLRYPLDVPGQPI